MEALHAAVLPLRQGRYEAVLYQASRIQSPPCFAVLSIFASGLLAYIVH